MSNYMTRPESEPIGGVLALHAWWGLNDFFRSFCDDLMKEGYAVVAPDLHNGTIAATIPEARKLRAALDRDNTSKRILQALKHLQGDVDKKPIAVMGFSMGAFWALKLLEEKPKAFTAAVLFYGARGGEYAKTKCAFQGHFAQKDAYVADSGRQKLERTLKKRGNEVSFNVYPNTHHWFFEADRPEYDEQAAELAWKRTIEFLKKAIS